MKKDYYENYEIEKDEIVEIMLFKEIKEEEGTRYVLKEGDFYSESEKFVFITKPYKNSYILKRTINKDAIREIKFRNLVAEREKEEEDKKRSEEYWKKECEKLGIEYTD